MKKTLLCIALFALSVIFMSCESRIKEGEVYAKEFHPAHTALVMMPIVHSTGKSFFTTFVPIPFFYPESWSIGFQRFSSKRSKWIKRTVWVSRSVYDATTIGAWYKMTDKDMDSQPRIKQEDTL